MAHRAAVFSSYRRLYRARIALFRHDIEAMTKSRDAVRVEYLKHGTDNINDEQHFQSLLGMADEAADMLRHSIIQGRLNSKTGHYEVKVNENHIAKHTGIVGQQPPLVQPITKEVVEQMENKHPSAVKIETTKASGY